jgi:predicted ArsR family transcriptional regulator
VVQLEARMKKSGMKKTATKQVRADQACGEAGADIAAVAGLDEPTRRRVYDHVRACALPVSRDEVAASLGVPRRTAAFHLDRLAGLGLLSVSFARRTGRSGPGAGRTSKLYQRSAREVSVSLPSRHYDLAGQLLAGAVAEAQESGEPPREVLGRRARDFGEAIAREHSVEHAQPGLGDAGALMGILASHGFEPRLAGDSIVLHNCPFHALAQQHTDLVCGMNLHLLEGVLDGLGDTGLSARLDPGRARCCVRMEAAGQS